MPELTINLDNGKQIRPDGILKNRYTISCGYWESKDSSDDLNKEIELKFANGYPKENILFEDSQTAVLIINEKQTKM